MKIITRNTMAASAARRLPHYNCLGEVHAALAALGKNPDPDEVDRVIGHGGYTALPLCSECLKAPEGWAVQVQASPMGHGAKAILCPACARALASLVKAQGGQV